MTLEFNDQGNLTMKSQLHDYQYRGIELEDLSLLFFVANTYEESIPKSQKTPTDVPLDDEPGPTGDSMQVRKRGRPRNDRVNYLARHSKSKVLTRVIRTPGHNVIPNIVGRFLPRRDDPDTYDFYCASMLALLKPWRSLQDIGNKDGTWKEQLTEFLASAPKRIHDILAGIQYYYDSSDSAQKVSQNSHGNSRPNDEDELQQLDSTQVTAGRQDEFDKGHTEITEEDLNRLIAAQAPWRELEHGRHAIEVAKSAHIFHNDVSAWEVNILPVGKATDSNLSQLQQWQDSLQHDRLRCKGLHMDDAAIEREADVGEVTTNFTVPEPDGTVEQAGTALQSS